MAKTLETRLDDLERQVGAARLHTIVLAFNETREQAIERYERENDCKIEEADFTVFVRRFFDYETEESIAAAQAEQKRRACRLRHDLPEPQELSEVLAPPRADSRPAAPEPSHDPAGCTAEEWDKWHGAISNTPEVIQRLERQQLAITNDSGNP